MDVAVLGYDYTSGGEDVNDVEDRYRMRILIKSVAPEKREFIEALPRNATGKVLKRNLRDMYVDEGTAAIT